MELVEWEKVIGDGSIESVVINFKTGARMTLNFEQFKDFIAKVQNR